MKNHKPSADNGTKDKQDFVELLVNNNNQEIQSLPTKGFVRKPTTSIKLDVIILFLQNHIDQMNSKD